MSLREINLYRGLLEPVKIKRVAAPTAKPRRCPQCGGGNELAVCQPCQRLLRTYAGVMNQQALKQWIDG